eukprot:m.354725 g.354725  ORF g.354725 m.354725 type:complete len:208 (+) comp17089_c0_seq1:743-1366(+)
MPIESVDVVSSPGYGWDTRHRYGKNTLMGQWYQPTNTPLLGSQTLPSTTTTRQDFTPKTSFDPTTTTAAGEYGSRHLRVSKALREHPQHTTLHMTSTNAPSRPSTVNRGKIGYLSGSRCYDRHAGKWVPEPVDLEADGEWSPRTTLVSTMRGKWHKQRQEDDNPYQSTFQQSFKLPSLNGSATQFHRSSPFSRTHSPHVLYRGTSPK